MPPAIIVYRFVITDCIWSDREYNLTNWIKTLSRIRWFKNLL